MSLRRSYTDGPTEYQKLYGSDLPPSLRWGSARRHTGIHGADVASRSEFHSKFPQTSSYAARAESDSYRAKIGAAAVGGLAGYAIRRRGRSHSYGSIDRLAADLAEERAELRLDRRMRSRSHGRGDTGSRGSKGRGRSGFYRRELNHLERRIPAAQDTSNVETFERKRRPYAVTSSVEIKAKPLFLQGAPGEITPVEQSDAEDNLDRVSEWLDKSEIGSAEARNREVAIIDRENIGFSEVRRTYEKSKSGTDLSAEAGAEGSDNASAGDRVIYRERHSHHRRRSRRQATDVPASPERRSPRRSRPKTTRSDSSGQSYSTWAPRTSTLWFAKSWSVRPAKELHMKFHGQGPTSRVSPKIVTELSCDPLAQVRPAPFTFQRVRSWRYNQVLPTIKPTLKRVIHATYGDMLQNEALKGPNQPGFIAVPQSCSSQGDTLYHILNLQQDQLDFEAFKNIVVNLPELRNVRDSVEAHLGKAQRLHEQQTHNGDATRSMNGFCHHVEASAGQASMMLVGLPFVQLQEHNHRTESELNSMVIMKRLLSHSRGSQTSKNQAAAHPDTAHATRTLFQYLNPRDNSRRDLKQVVCHMLGPRDKRYLCVSQVWILIVNEGKSLRLVWILEATNADHWTELIITSSSLSESDLCGDLLLPPTACTTLPKRTLVNVHVVSEDGRQWILRPSDCLSYIDFAANFSDITHQFAEDFVIFHDQEEVKASDWAKKMSQACTATLHLSLQRSKASDQSHWYSPVWSYRSGRFKWKEVPISRGLAERILLMRHSSSVHILVSASGEERSDQVKQFRRFVRQVRLYQDGRLPTAPSVGDQNHEKAQSPVSGLQTDGSDDIGWLDPESPWYNEDETTGSETEPEHARNDRYSSRRRNRRRRGFDLIYLLPKTATQARALASLGIAFTEQANDFIVAGGLDKSQLFDVMQMTSKLYNLEGLRKIAGDCLLRTPTSGDDSSDLESNAPDISNADRNGRPESVEGHHTTADVFDEAGMYEHCSRMGRDVLHHKLVAWMTTPLPDTSAHTNNVIGIPPPHANPWGLRRLLGWTYARHTNARTGEEMHIAPSRFALFNVFLDGLWLALSTSKLTRVSDELRTVEEKLAGAILSLVTRIHQYMERAEELPYHGFYYSTSQNFTRLFRALNSLETHALTIETLHEVVKSTTFHAVYSAVLRHTTIALLLATKALTELEDQTDILEAEKQRRNEALAKISSNVDSSADYIHVEECCSKIFGARNEGHRQKRFRKSVDHLERLGWNRAAARTILLNECRRRRITHHADSAARMLETSFLKALTPDPSRKIQWKAAALPTDLVALLITQILERPVLDNQDALNMYMRYVTDLESNILTGEPSREPLDRIRYLRHELNAFSQLQQEQIDILGQLTSALLSSDDAQDYPSRDDPHPRRTVFAALPKGIQIQKDIIQSLSDMLDDLQSEARAQMLGVQDWRDNAAVVFTIITVIFLPLSFVSSVFGMNTSDVRDMELTQWVFWTSATVFTILVILITVYFVDVPPLWRWLERKSGDDGRDKVVPQPTQRSRSHFFAGLGRHSGGFADADDGTGLDVQRNDTMKAEDLMASDGQDSSTTSDEEK